MLFPADHDERAVFLQKNFNRAREKSNPFVDDWEERSNQFFTGP